MVLLTSLVREATAGVWVGALGVGAEGEDEEDDEADGEEDDPEDGEHGDILHGVVSIPRPGLASCGFGICNGSRDDLPCYELLLYSRLVPLSEAPRIHCMAHRHNLPLFTQP